MTVWSIIRQNISLFYRPLNLCSQHLLSWLAEDCFAITHSLITLQSVLRSRDGVFCPGFAETQLVFGSPICQLHVAFCKLCECQQRMSLFKPAGLSISCCLRRWAVLPYPGPSLRALWVFSGLVIAGSFGHFSVSMEPVALFIWLTITDVLISLKVSHVGKTCSDLFS